MSETTLVSVTTETSIQTTFFTQNGIFRSRSGAVVISDTI